MLSLLPAFAWAQSSTDAPGASSDQWQFRIAPNLWAAGLDGTSRVGGASETRVDASFSDITEVLDMGFMTALEARRGPWGIVGDVFYVNLGEKTQPLQNDLGRVDASIKNTIFHLAVAYRVAESASGHVDVLGGARYSEVESELKLPSSTTYPDGVRVKGSDDWVDAIVGLRGVHRFNDKWAANGYVDVGLGGDDSSWQAMAGIEYVISHTTQVEFGYRYLSQDYDSAKFAYEMDTAGPFLGMSFWF
ncbi:hypothetical protein ABB29_03140 [Pseudoxanthomonas dokdonensis]|uniref:Outer membrane protein beta-barrel domain-containing protein n=1 Tax=Pseudoxanthomonas dokdonensis TaxID=344882 RepID=A0A0R0D0T1_9GAMM|nr:hypothetical protein ABB29_03140 [Pseudoxanthomonas dokdonensis]